MSPTTGARRRSLRRILQTSRVTSQQQLVDMLEHEGHSVTQATVSRDLVALGAVKLRGEDGTARYELRPAVELDEAIRALARTLSEFAEDVAASANLVVIRTPPGAAHLLASSIDAAALDGALGTVAGDDTLLVIAADPNGGGELAELLERIGATP